MEVLEKQLNEVFVEKAPVQLPENVKKWLVEYNPIIGLIVGILGLLASLGLWRAAHAVNTLATYTNSLYNSLGVANKVDNHLGLAFWVAFFALLAQSVIWIVAYPGLKAHSKARGWNILYYGALISVVADVFYGVYDSSIVSVIGRLIGSAIGLYFLFQIRSYYNGAKTPAAAKPADKPAEKPADTTAEK